ncbi:SDR family oxidoreductase [Nocardioides fonticola]|uniref:SDR family oxidoreductase n=1 Tax=Nocardioides fonticola TaxID=450363 RepID=A0ABP7XKY2_9ACTN
MTRTYVVSGGASGIGAATTALLREQGHRVITVDLRDADVIGDLATPAGRDAAVTAVRALVDPAVGLHGVVPCAGVAGLTGTDPQLLVSVNFFGAIALVEGLRDLLAVPGDAAVAFLASNSITGMPGWQLATAEACLAEDEEAARAAAAQVEAVMVYPSTKAALAWWARTHGIREEWIGAGIRLNAVAPGKIATPMTEALAADPVFGPLGEAYPTAIGRDGRPEEIAAVIGFLLSPASSLLVGTTIYADGGTDAMLHPRSPAGWDPK